MQKLNKKNIIAFWGCTFTFTRAFFGTSLCLHLLNYYNLFAVYKVKIKVDLPPGVLRYTYPLNTECFASFIVLRSDSNSTHAAFVGVRFWITSSRQDGAPQITMILTLTSLSAWAHKRMSSWSFWRNVTIWETDWLDSVAKLIPNSLL